MEHPLRFMTGVAVPPVRDPTRQDSMLVSREATERFKGLAVMLGVGAVLLGVLSLALPEGAVVISGAVVAVLALVVAAAQGVRAALNTRGADPVPLRWASAAGLAGLAGLLVGWPAETFAALCLALIVVLFAHLAARAVCLLREHDRRWRSRAVGAVLVGGVLAGVTLGGWPGAAVWATGTLGGAILAFAGFWLIRIGTAHDSHSAHDLSGRWPR